MKLDFSRLPAALFLFSVFLVACASVTKSSTTGVTDTAPAQDAVQDTGPETNGAEDLTSRPNWQQIELTDVRTGETFTLSSFENQVVIVEAMAVWCPLCDQQQLQIKSALGELGDDVVAVSLGVDPSESAEIVARHANDLDLPWRFTVAGPELASMLQREFGPQILAPPSTPVLLIGPDGATTLTPFGIKGWDELVNFTKPLIP